MRVIHLTDLHLTPPNARSVTLWSGVTRWLPSEFDFVVISGDLTQQAEPDEYRQLHDFLVNNLLGRVPQRDPARVIMVPGNHDVSWSADDIIDRGATISDDDVLRYLKDPETPREDGSQIRVELGARTVTSLAISRAHYHRRFANCQKFLEDFYGTLPAPHRRFVLNDVNPGNHWSAHVFKDEGIAFAGLNSCAMNDRYWRGAAFSEDAIAAAGRYLDDCAPHCLRIAVWHHGLTSMRGSPDHVSIRELGQIINQKFHLGMHGHTHEDEVNTLLPLFGERSIPMIATGSFGAGPSVRPGGLRNQVSLMEITHAFIRRQLFHMDDRTLQWTKSDPVTIPLSSRPGRASVRAHQSFVGHHERSVVVDEQGVTSITVTMADVEIDGELDLATPAEAWGTIDEDKDARIWVGGAQRLLKVQRPPDGARFYVAAAPPLKCDKLQWTYTLSNIFALDIDEVGVLPAGAPEGPLYPGEHDMLLHGVRVCSRELVLRLKLPRGYLKDAGSCRVQYQDAGGAWENDPPDTSIVIEKPSSDQVLLRVRHPRLGHRYGVAYSLNHRRPQLETHHRLLLERVIADCRDVPRDAGSLSQALTDAIAGALATALPDQIPVCWISHLWHASSQALVPAFGTFPAHSWNLTLRYGEGVAGHAFRVRSPAVYYQNATTTSSRVLYRKATTTPPSPDDLWMVSLPLLVLPSGPALGTFGFAEHDHANGTFERIARELTAQANPADAPNFPQINQMFRNLMHVASVAFWARLAGWPGIDRATRQVAADLRARWLEDTPGELSLR